MVMIRLIHRQSENFQNILANLFADDNDTNIKTLRKYMFVSISIPGDDTRVTFQGLVRTRGNFRRNVYHCIITNIYKISNIFQVPVVSEDGDTPMEDAASDAPAS